MNDTKPIIVPYRETEEGCEPNTDDVLLASNEYGGSIIVSVMDGDQLVLRSQKSVDLFIEALQSCRHVLRN